MLIFCSKHLEKSTFMFIFANKKEMRTNWMIDEVRRSITPEMKLQMEMSVAIANRICDILEAKGMTQKELARKLGKTETGEPMAVRHTQPDAFHYQQGIGSPR